jgi:RHS repeat-associated protein
MACAILGVGLAAAPAAAQITALAPFDTTLDGRNELVGVAVGADGSRYVSDRGAGFVYRIDAAGAPTTAAANLDRPAGLALDANGRLLIAEEHAGRILRLEANGSLTVLATGLKTPRWIVVNPDGSLYVSAHRVTSPDGADDSEGRVIVRVVIGGSMSEVATGIRQAQGLTRVNGSLIVASKGLASGPDSAGVLLRYPVLADGSLGAPVTWLGTGLKQPMGLVLDTLGAVYVSSKELTVEADTSKRAIGKVHPDVHLTDFAANLTDPQGVALGADGALYLADGKAGRLLRFRAPAAPALDALAEFTNQASVSVSGSTEAGARVDVFVNDATSAVSGTADAGGHFAISVALTPNTLNALEVFATPHGGDGLTSPAATAQTTHDNLAPGLSFQAPPEGAYVRGPVTVTARATDAGSGVASITLTAAGQPLSPALDPAPPAADITATATWNTATVADGTQTLRVTATDRAGNESAPLTRAVIVDNTPPETTITDGPTGTLSVATATFTLSGSDNLTPAADLVFAWRLDDGPWSAFTSATSASLSGLTETSHTFEVKARDRAGNEDPTPATRTFNVLLGPVIADVTPASGTIGTFVTITGSHFEPGPTSVTFNGLPAVLRSVSATMITTTVPIGATTGPLVVTSPRGSASRTFTVTLTGEFTLTGSPATVRAIGGDQTSVNVAVGGTGAFTSLVAVSVAPAVSGVTASFGAPFIAPGANTPLTFRVDAGVPPGSYAFTVTGEASIDGRGVTQTAPVTLEVLPAGTLAVTGRIMTAESIPQPIPGVSVALGSAFVLTDVAGNFILQAPPTGPNMLFVDGRTASVPNAQFPIIETQINVGTSGATRVPFTIYLPKLDTANAVNLPVDAAGFVTVETKVTTPAIPGLEVTVPQGTRIIGPDGNPVAQLVITPVPLDRSPMPLPPGKAFPFLFAINPGGSVPSTPLPITFPNTNEAPPGTSADMYYFDLSIGDWNIWGRGTVSADGRQIVSDPGYGLPRLAWHTVCDGARCLPSNSGTPPGNNKPGKKGGDPVDLFTGRFHVTNTDVTLPGRLPIHIQRSYWSGLTRVGLFGVGWNLEGYDVKLLGRGTALTLIQGDQAELLFVPDGTGRWINLAAPFMAGAVITQLPGDFVFQLRFKDGTIHRFDRIVGFANVAALAAITDRNGSTLTITRTDTGPTSFGFITRITEPTGRHIDIEYDTAGRIKTITDPIGRTVQYAYDSQGRLENVTDQAGGVTTYVYDAAHRIITITDPRRITYLSNQYDVAGRVIRQTQADGGVWQFDYATQGDSVLQTVLTDPRGNTATHRFDSRGFEQSATDALGQTTSYTYSPISSLLMAVTDALGRVTRFDHDANGNIVTVTDPAGIVRGFTFHPSFNRVTSASTPLAPPTTFGYDGLGNMTTITDPRGKTTTITYNAFGQPLTVSDPLGHVSSFDYDPAGNLIATTDPLGNTTRFDYDPVGRRIRTIDPRGKVTQFGYDVLNRITSITDPLGSLTRFGFDANGNLLSTTDARDNRVTHTYDNMDRLAERIDALSATESFAYDVAGNLIRHINRNGQLSTYVYDALNRLTTSSYADGSGTTFAYDGAGRLVRVYDSTGGTLTNAYDTLDRLIRQSTSAGDVTYQYDALSRRTQFGLPGSPPTTYDYDVASRLRKIIQASELVTIDYDDAGRRTLLGLPNGVSAEYHYDLASRLTELVYRRNETIIGNLTYTYDTTGNRNRVGGSLARTSLPNTVTTSSYDAANRQRIFGDRQMTFDANGNVTAIIEPQGVTALAWDPRDRLVAIEAPGMVASFRYAFGRRTHKTINGGTSQFLYDGSEISQQFDVNRTVTYLRSLSTDETLAMTTSEGTLSFLQDAVGSTLAVVDASGSRLTEYMYEPFGATTITNPGFENPFQFTGRENDILAGLYYYRARYYHPGLGRFISEDPILAPMFGVAECNSPTGPLWMGLRTTNGAAMSSRLMATVGNQATWPLPLLLRTAPNVAPSLMTAYAYASNSPPNRRDPTGLMSEDLCLGLCRITYAVICSLACEPFLHVNPVGWLFCNIACFEVGEVMCHNQCSKKGGKH